MQVAFSPAYPNDLISGLDHRSKAFSYYFTLLLFDYLGLLLWPFLYGIAQNLLVCIVLFMTFPYIMDASSFL